MGRVVLDISMSLDGFIAGPNPSLEEPLGAGGERLHDWTVGLASWRERHGESGGALTADDEVVAESRAAAGAKDVLVAGDANLAQQVLSAGMLDEMQIHLVPVLLGDGTRLLEHLERTTIQLESTRVIESPAVTHLRYRVIRQA